MYITHLMIGLFINVPQSQGCMVKTIGLRFLNKVLKFLGFNVRTVALGTLDTRIRSRGRPIPGPMGYPVFRCQLKSWSTFEKISKSPVIKNTLIIKISLFFQDNYFFDDL